MKLDIITQAESLDKIKETAEQYLGHELRLIPETLTVFPSFIVRPANQVVITGIWKYRIFFHQGRYHFGTIVEIYSKRT